VLARNGKGLAPAATGNETQRFNRKFEPNSRYSSNLKIIHAELHGADHAMALGISATSITPVLNLCAKLIEGGCDRHRPLHAYRGEILCLRVRSIGEAAELEVNAKGTGFIPFRAVRTASPMRFFGEGGQ